MNLEWILKFLLSCCVELCINLQPSDINLVSFFFWQFWCSRIYSFQSRFLLLLKKERKKSENLWRHSLPKQLKRRRNNSFFPRKTIKCKKQSSSLFSECENLWFFFCCYYCCCCGICDSSLNELDFLKNTKRWIFSLQTRKILHHLLSAPLEGIKRIIITISEVISFFSSMFNKCVIFSLSPLVLILHWLWVLVMSIYYPKKNETRLELRNFLLFSIFLFDFVRV